MCHNVKNNPTYILGFWVVSYYYHCMPYTVPSKSNRPPLSFPMITYSCLLSNRGTLKFRLCFKQYKLIHNHSFTHSFEISKYLYYSTENCMLIWGMIGVACYFWMALYIYIYIYSKTRIYRNPRDLSKYFDI